MGVDSLGLAVTGGGDAELAGVNDFAEGFLAYETRAARVIGSAEAARGHCLLNAYAGALWMLLESPEAPARARPYLARARAAADGATSREQGLVHALEAWAADDIDGAIAALETVVVGAPRDLAAAKLLQYMHFNLGRFPDMLRVAHAAAAAAPESPYVHGMLAFGYEQCHLLDLAERAAWRALEIRAKEPWAQHALAHVDLTRGRIREGADFLEGVRATWTDLNSFMETHLWWHLSLLRISEGDFAAALALYDTHVWGADPTYSQDQVGAVSLLARLELAGVDVGDRWSDVSSRVAARGPDVTQPFLTLHYVYALARTDRPELSALLDAMRARARTAPRPAAAAWADAALPAAEAIIAHARGDHAAAAAILGPALGGMWRIGGSHAQRDLFDQVRLDSLIRIGDLTAAQQVLELRRRFEPDGAALNRALAGVYRGLGLEAEADAAAARSAGAAGPAG